MGWARSGRFPERPPPRARRCARPPGRRYPDPREQPTLEPILLANILTGVLTAMAAFVLTRRWLAARAERGARLTDDAIRQIEQHGRLESEEPLDLGEIDAEERRFWEEKEWDESEEWPGA